MELQEFNGVTGYLYISDYKDYNISIIFMELQELYGLTGGLWSYWISVDISL